MLAGGQCSSSMAFALVNFLPSGTWCGIPFLLHFESLSCDPKLAHLLSPLKGYSQARPQRGEKDVALLAVVAVSWLVFLN